MKPSVDRAIRARRESRYIEFKQGFDPGAARDWCELIKDFAAIANVGGGVVLVGVNNRGEPTSSDISKLLELDPVAISDKLHRYTDAHFADFDIESSHKDGAQIACIKIGTAFPPIVFTKPGTYAVDGGRQRTAFSQGTVYFRHGAKSEPATSDDLRQVLERQLENVRDSWLGDVQRVVKAPAGSQIAVLPPMIKHADSVEGRPIQIVNDPGAPAYRVVDFDKSHPHRATEAVEEIAKRLPTRVRFNNFDLVAIRRVHKLDDNEGYVHKPKFGSPQYSRSLVDWVVRQHANDPRFFDKARAKYRE